MSAPAQPSASRGPVPSSSEKPTSSALQLLTADDLATRWQVTRAHVYRLAREGRVPSVRVGRYFRFALPVIERWEQGGGADA
jgi:excisionase family DNA binding protein